MAEIGYSGKPLYQKLGIKEGMKIRLINAPEEYFDWLGANFSPNVVKSGSATFVHLFSIQMQELGQTFRKIISEIPSDAVIWISWYKKSAKKLTDIDEQAIRDLVLPLGWVDIKVCAVSAEWSGLKIVKRKELR